MPVTILTGFLGSGKTTLLRRALDAPAFADTAVIINEVGEIAIDHYLVDLVEGEVLELPGGCLCCAVREDLAQTLRQLIERRDNGDIRKFQRIVVETSGLADPAPILFTLGTDPMLDQRLRLDRVVTVVDALAGADTIARFAEAARQTALADRLYISKTDLAPFSDPLAVWLDALNPTAERVAGAKDTDPATVLFGGSSHARGGGSQSEIQADHTHGIATFTLILRQAPSRLDFAKALGRLAMDRGNDLLRVKGLIAFADRPEQPALVQAAQHTMFAPDWLPDWPDDDRRSRLVFIVHDIAPDEILGHFAFAAPSIVETPGSIPHRHE